MQGETVVNEPFLTGRQFITKKRSNAIGVLPAKNKSTIIGIEGEPAIQAASHVVYITEKESWAEYTSLRDPTRDPQKRRIGPINLMATDGKIIFM